MHLQCIIVVCEPCLALRDWPWHEPQPMQPTANNTSSRGTWPYLEWIYSPVSAIQTPSVSSRAADLPWSQFCVLDVITRLSWQVMDCKTSGAVQGRSMARTVTTVSALSPSLNLPWPVSPAVANPKPKMLWQCTIVCTRPRPLRSNTE